MSDVVGAALDIAFSTPKEPFIKDVSSEGEGGRGVEKLELLGDFQGLFGETSWGRVVKSHEKWENATEIPFMDVT